LSLEGRLRENMVIHGEHLDSLIFVILANEWKTVKTVQPDR
jgi:RimJ/RimL family protein N-acetyltransferase